MKTGEIATKRMEKQKWGQAPRPAEPVPIFVSGSKLENETSFGMEREFREVRSSLLAQPALKQKWGQARRPAEPVPIFAISA
jgi:hypothetical protein